MLTSIRLGAAEDLELAAGYRGFSILVRADVNERDLLKNGEWLLTGIVYPTPWLPGQEAGCALRGQAENHTPPVRKCTCGYYGQRSPPAFNSDKEWFAIFRPPIVSFIRGYGRVMLHTTGFRSQFMLLDAIDSGVCWSHLHYPTYEMVRATRIQFVYATSSGVSSSLIKQEDIIGWRVYDVACDECPLDSPVRPSVTLRYDDILERLAQAYNCAVTPLY
jgi:hypothetical protein